MKALDWTRPENLRFRDYEGAEILEIVMFQNAGLVCRFPVFVCYKVKGMITYTSYTLDGHINTFTTNHYRDIIEINETTNQDEEKL